MDTFENNVFQPENEPIPPQPEAAPEPAPQSTAQPEPQNPSQLPYYSWPGEPASYRGAGAGRKESPYSNSPYVMNHQSRQPQQSSGYPYIPQPQPQEPIKPEAKQAVQPPREKRKGGFWKTTLAAVLTLALVAGSCAVTAASVNSYWERRNAETQQAMNDLSDQIAGLQEQMDASASQPQIITPTPDTSADEDRIIVQTPITLVDGQMTPGQLYAQCVDSVVAISCSVESYDFGQISEGTSSGSGFILTDNGYVVTNHHVIEGAVSVTVITNDGTEYPAKIVGSDSTNDVAVLKVDAAGLPAVELGSSTDLLIGDMVVAIGNPLGELTSTQTVGYVSGKDREVTTDGTMINMLQTDAAINPGNSGGPLFNMYGQVIGITTAKYSGTTSSGASIEGIGFAIPIDDILGIINDLMEYGYVTGAYMGVEVRNMDSAAASTYGLPMGAYVSSVVEEGAADRAGIQVRDIITAVDNYEIESINDLSLALRNYKAGDSAVITLVRGGSQMEVTIIFDEKPNTSTQSVTPEEDSSMPNEGSFDEWYDYFFPEIDGD